MCQTTADLLKTILHKSKQLKIQLQHWVGNQSVESPKNIPVYLHFMVDYKLHIKTESETLTIIREKISCFLNRQALFVLI